MTPKISILMSDTGGGHRASGEALIAGFRERRDDLAIDMVDLWSEHTPPPINRLGDTYPFLVNRVPGLWSLLWKGTEEDRLIRVAARVLRVATGGSIRRYYADARPDLVISVHPLLQAVPLKVLRERSSDVPFVTVVTDLASAHRTWFHPGVTRCFVASDEARQRAQAAGLTEDQIRLVGLPVRPAFAETPRPQSVLRRELDIDPDLPAVLVMGGGEGMGGLGEIVTALAQRLSETSVGGQVVAICGRNRRLQEELDAHAWPVSVPVRVLGFVDNVPAWMGACDCIVTKAGPGTIAEALTRGLPILLSGFVPGQEEGNIPFVVESGVGEYAEDPVAIADTVARWFGVERDDLAAMSRRAMELARPEATYHIVDSLLGLMEAQNERGQAAGRAAEAV